MPATQKYDGTDPVVQFPDKRVAIRPPSHAFLKATSSCSSVYRHFVGSSCSPPFPRVNFKLHRVARNPASLGARFARANVYSRVCGRETAGIQPVDKQTNINFYAIPLTLSQFPRARATPPVSRES